MTTKAAILKSIRQHCLECCGGHFKEVENCTRPSCRLYAFRMGKDPKPSKSRQATSRNFVSNVSTEGEFSLEVDENV